MLFRLSTFGVIAFLVVVVGGGALIGVLIGREMRGRPSEHLKEASGTMQAALLGFVGLILAFGLSLAVTRYETRRETVADEANALSSAYLQAETIPEPMRTESLGLLRQYADQRVALARAVPDSDAFDLAKVRSDKLANKLWAQAGEALNAEPVGSAVRLYVETLTETIDMDTTRRAALANRVPTPVMLVEVLGASVALGVFGFYLALSGRSLVAVAVVAAVVITILFVTVDLDRPRRGFIIVPDAPLVEARHGMRGPPVAAAPNS